MASEARSFIRFLNTRNVRPIEIYKEIEHVGIGHTPYSASDFHFHIFPKQKKFLSGNDKELEEAVTS